MNGFSLKHLWWLCLLLSGLAVSRWLFSCQPLAQGHIRPIETVEKAVPPKPVASARALPQEPTYTYVGQVQHEAQKRGSRGQKAAKDRSVRVLRRQATKPQTGQVPDLDIRLNGQDIERVMRYFGYLPAIKSRTRLLGKIVGNRFVPLAPGEVARYARRGRAGSDFPRAALWKRRVARELGLPESELTVIFLVPHATERFFIAAEKAALQRTGRAPQEVALVRAHFDAHLALVVDAVLTRSGQSVAVDSVRQLFAEH